MFTGIVQTLGRVVSLTGTASGVRLVIDHDGLTLPVNRGDSVCVSGICLTALSPSSERLTFDVVPETLRLTTLGDLRPGDAVNLEPALVAGQPLGGHVVQGHADGVAEVVAVDESNGQWRTTLRPPAALMDYLTPKGSIALDGVSLTLASVGRDTFDVALIPETLERTTLRERRAGSRVNLEADPLAKTVIHWLERRRSGGSGSGDEVEAVTMDLLRETGFVK